LRPSGLVLQRGDEVARIGDRLPHLRQERRAAAVVLQDEAVDAGPQSVDEIFLAGHEDALGRREQRYLDRRRVKLSRGERRKARIAKRRGKRVLAHIDPQRTDRLERSYAAAQLARDYGASRRSRPVAQAPDRWVRHPR
jgi:hypothetical protein